MNNMIERIIHNSTLLSIIIYRDFKKHGIEFLTPNDFSQQLAYMNRPKGHVIESHVHNLVPRNVNFTQEVLFIKSGKVRIDFYDDEKNYIQSKILREGDVILLAAGGHGIEMLEQSEIIEVKQGPYAGEMDKVRFQGIDQTKVVIK